MLVRAPKPQWPVVARTCRIQSSVLRPARLKRLRVSRSTRCRSLAPRHVFASASIICGQTYGGA